MSGSAGTSSGAESGSGSTTARVESGAGAAQTADATSEPTTASTPSASPAELIARLGAIRDRVLPLLEAIRREYAARVPGGYPTLIDNVERGGTVGINVAPGFGAYFMTDGQELFAEQHTVSLRSDTLSAANAEKFAGHPSIQRLPIDESWSDLQFRNVIAQVISRWNFQQTRIYRVDS